MAREGGFHTRKSLVFRHSEIYSDAICVLKVCFISGELSLCHYLNCNWDFCRDA